MSRSKQAARKKKASSKAAVHPPHLTLKERKNKALTKKQLHRQEKQERKQRNAENQKSVASLFGPLKGASASKNNNKKKGKPDPPQSFGSFGPLSDSKKRKGKSDPPQSLREAAAQQKKPRKNKSDQNSSNSNSNSHKRRVFSFTVDGSPLHYQSKNQSQSQPKKNQKPKKVLGGKYPPPKSQFQLPSVQNHPDCAVPWWTPQDKQEFSAREQNCCQHNETHYLWGQTIPHAFLHHLDAELSNFAQYVSLTQEEGAARQFVVDQVQTLSQTKLDDVDIHDIDNVKVQVFGSFATPAVCAFCSDVDMALWGVVKPPDDHGDRKGQHLRFCASDDSDDDNDDDDYQKKPPATAFKREERIDKWRNVLDEAFADQDDHDYDESASAVASTKGGWQSALEQLLEGCNEGPDSYYHHQEQPQEEEEQQHTVDQHLEQDEQDKKKKAEPEIVDLTASSPVASKKAAAKSPEEEKKQEEVSTDTMGKASATAAAATKSVQMASETLAVAGSNDLFVIDRVGITNVDKPKDNQAAVINTNDKKNSTTATASEPSDASNIDCAVGQSGETHSSATAKATEESSEPTDNRHDNDGGSDSEEDTADPLASLYKRQSVKNSGNAVAAKTAEDPEKAIISVSSDSEHSSDDDDDEDDYKNHIDYVDNCTSKKDNIDIRVSFVSSPAPLQRRQSFGPTGHVRVQVVKALNNLGNILKRRQYTQSVQVIRKARVPIVKMQTVLGFEGDIAVGGHNGTDTSQYALTQVARFKSFAVVVLVLKILLWQHNLDTPFTGGLGSFKLYVLVAHHLEQHLALGGSDRPGEVFLSFLVRYGRVNKGIGLVGSHRGMDNRARTTLSQKTILESDGQYSADMSAVFLMDHCIELFQRCWGRLSKKFNYVTNCLSKDEQRKNARSLLIDLFDVEQLKEDRTECLQKAMLLSQYCKKTKEQERQREKQQQLQQTPSANRPTAKKQKSLKRKDSDDSKKSSSNNSNSNPKKTKPNPPNSSKRRRKSK